jgi:hypothetical protein
MKREKEENGVLKEVIRDVLRYDIWLKILTGVSIGLMIAGFCVPPTGVIDGSVLTGTGILAAFGALFEGGHAIDKGLDVKLKIKDTELEIENDEVEKTKIENGLPEE